MTCRVLCALTGALIAMATSADEPSVEKALQDRWTAAYNSGDVEALSAMYAADARLQQGYCPMVAGRDAIEAFWRDDLGEETTKTYLEVEDTLAFEDGLYLRGTYAVEIAATHEVEARRVGGTYSQIWRHDEATGWTIHRETWANLACADIVVKPPANAESAPVDNTASI